MLMKVCHVMYEDLMCLFPTWQRIIRDINRRGLYVHIHKIERISRIVVVLFDMFAQFLDGTSKQFNYATKIILLSSHVCQR